MILPRTFLESLAFFKRQGGGKAVNRKPGVCYQEPWGALENNDMHQPAP